MPASDRLLAAIRAACPSALWARGGRLVEAGAVRPGPRQPDEWEARVLDGRGAREVALFPEEAEWSCDCEGRFECCEHVAAAARVLCVEGAPATTDVGDGKMVAAFARRGGGLALECLWRQGERSAPVEVVSPVRLALTDRDRAVVALAEGLRPDRPIPGARLQRILQALAGGVEVTLDGAPVSLGAATTGLRVVVRDAPDGPGVHVRIVKDREVTESFEGGAVLRGGKLCALRGHGLESGTFRALAAGKIFAPEDLPRVSAELLPRLRRHLPVAVRTGRVAATTSARPRLAVEATAGDGELRLRARILYGEPPVLAVDGERVILLREGVAVPRRRPEWERRLRERASLGLEVPLGETVRLRGEAAVSQVERLRARSEEDPELLLRGGGLERFTLRGELEPRVEGGSLALEVGGRGADLHAVWTAFERGESLVPLGDGAGMAKIPRDFLERHGDLVADLLAARGAEVDAGAQGLLQARVHAAMDEPPPPELAPWLALLRGEAAPEVDLPESWRGELRPYQVEGVRWIARRRDLGLGALLADDMGLGKTVQTLAVLRGTCLVVAPTSVLSSWCEQAAEFRPDLQVCRYHGPRRAIDPGADLLVTSWALLRRDIDRLAERAWDTVVLDESHTMKNPDSQVARAARRLRARFRLALSGTPVENRVDDLWSQLAFLVPGAFGTLAEFRRRYGGADAQARAHLERRLRPLLLRRRKQEVARDLPSRTEVVLRCELSEAERAVYDGARAAARREVARLLGQGGRARPLDVLSALLRMRQAACHPGLVPGGRGGERSAKLEVLLERLREAAAEGHRALVFSQWTGLLDRVEPALAAAGLRYLRLDGSTRDRGAVVAAFQDPEGPPVMLVSLKAGGTGLTLTAADHVFLLDPWWNPAVEDQAADRAHRIGQTRPVIVHRLIASDTIDEAIWALQARKRELAGDLLDGPAAEGLTPEDLQALVAGG